MDTQGSNMRLLMTERDGPQTATAFTYWGRRHLQISGAGEDIDAGRIAAVVESAPPYMSDD